MNKLLIIFGTFVFISDVLGTMYNPMKDRLLSDIMIRNIIDRMSNELVDAADSYLDYQDDVHVNDDFYKENEYSRKIPFDYDRFDELNPNPSTRDQEYLQHSTLVSNQQLNDNSDSSHKIELAGHKGIKEEKNKNPLPAYCTPPNPCPIGYTSENNCLETFENTAAFSRDFQGAQDCMCDTEHMMDCSSNGENIQDGGLSSHITNSDFDQIVEHLQGANPFLRGEKLPIAAKKGLNVVPY
ncbi:hypothetical protein PV325_007943 [Microctonus aethiopoides]|uniref:Neuroendocrine protein 7B2 n=1 Tax=Microctonus aethiopoides TaxID=144406 RepID=A0AA39FYY7_9HYME|nr:hypothetical protein PV325_007943 [Microctonus aethiopoides]KAK0178191.1 hypothetical protein PV328_002165 [Microctonus aethiopoides]